MDDKNINYKASIKVSLIFTLIIIVAILSYYYDKKVIYDQRYDQDGKTYHVIVIQENP